LKGVTTKNNKEGERVFSPFRSSFMLKEGTLCMQRMNECENMRLRGSCRIEEGG